jgi:hypothetical protein
MLEKSTEGTIKNGKFRDKSTILKNTTEQATKNGKSSDKAPL